MISDDVWERLGHDPTLESLKILIGEDKVDLLSMHLGGANLWISKAPREDSPLVLAIGMDAAMKMGHVYGGMSFDVPVGPGRIARILDMHRNNVKVATIAAKLQIPRRRVYRILEAAESKNQHDLFS